MPRKFEEILSEMTELGLSDEVVDELTQAWAASPLRKERDEAVKNAEAALEQAKRYQQVVAGQRFKDLGIKIRPEALRTPDDLDWADDAKVREWATTAGLIEGPSAPEPGDEAAAAHDRIAAASSGATAAPSKDDDFQARLAQAKNADEVMALVQSAGLPTPQQ